MADFEGSSVDGVPEELNGLSIKASVESDKNSERVSVEYEKKSSNVSEDLENNSPKVPKEQKKNQPKEDSKTNSTKASEEQDNNPSKALCPAVFTYGPANVEGLVEGELKKWCTCGLSKTQPWCDGAHKGTGFRSLKWTVPRYQTKYEICNCKHTKAPPFCDGTHTNLPEVVLQRQAECSNQEGHVKDCKLCTGCGWVPDF